MNNEEILVLSQELNNRKTELMLELKNLNSDRHRENKPLDKDFSEQAVERENDEVVDRLHEKVSQQIQQINEALERIKQNQFGFCSICNEPIPDKRLQIVPFAKTCVKCAD